MRAILLLLIFAMFLLPDSDAISQGVAINQDHSPPASSSILDIKSSNMGVLLPRLTSEQRNNIEGPSHGLLIFNLSLGTFEYYDSLFSVWSSLCEENTYFTDTLRASGEDTVISGYTLPGEAAANKKILIYIDSNVAISGINYFPAMDLQAAAAGSSVLIINHGKIIGKGGKGGRGRHTYIPPCLELSLFEIHGSDGGHAIYSPNGIMLTVKNYGILGGGGGGGGGGGAGSWAPNAGGGGGGGAGFGMPGNYGVNIYYDLIYYDCFEDHSNTLAQWGQFGMLLSGGAGGAGGNDGGASTPGGNGGNGGGPGQPGQPGGAGANNGGIGGQPGKAISGNTGHNTVINYGGGTVFGDID